MVDVCLQAIRAVGVSSSQCSTGGGCFVFVFVFSCFSLSLLEQAEAFGFWFVEIDGCWRMAGGDVVQSLDLLTSVGSFSTRIFLLRSLALSGLDGYLAGRAALSWSARDQHTSGVFHPAPARAGYGLIFRLRNVLIWTSEGRPLLGGSRRRRVFCTRWFLRLFVSCACFPELLLVFGCKFFTCFTVYRSSVAALS